jgi:glycerate dehydrogenase
MRVVFLDKASLDRGDIDYSLIDPSLIEWIAYDYTSASQVLERVMDADVVVSNKVVLDDAVLSQARSLKLICVAATGTNNVDLDSARTHNIVVSNARAYATASVVEHVFGVLISLMRNIPDYQRAATDGRWAQSDQFCYLDKPIIELAGKTMGIIGYGELGRAVADVAKAFGMHILVSQRPGSHDKPHGRHHIDDVLKQSDVLTLHCPLADNTRNLIDRRALSQMPRHAILINTARGGIVNEMDLLHALNEQVIAAAAIDVLLEEPPASHHALLQASLPNLVITPHVAWASLQARQRLLGEVLDNIKSFSQGKVRNQVV